MAASVTYIGINLKFLRRIRGISQAELAKEVGLSRNNIASYESGMVEPNSKNFIKIATFFQVNPQDILEKILSENPVEIVPMENEPESAIDRYIKDHVEEFTKQTNTMTKIFEGYNEFYNMQRDNEMSAQEKELHGTVDNILQLMQTLVSTNWKLIQSIFPNQEQ